MLNGAPPFYEKNKERMMSRIVTEDVIIKNKYTPECQSLLRGLLTRNVISINLKANELNLCPVKESITSGMWSLGELRNP